MFIGNFRVLVADPNFNGIILTSLTRELKKAGCEVIAVAGAGEALKRVENGEIDIVISELMMPEISGLEMLRQLRCFSAVPVIIFSSQAGSGWIVEALNAGADKYVVKPASSEEVVLLVRAVMRRAGNHAALSHKIFVGKGGCIIDLEERFLLGNGKKVNFAPTECRLLQCLTKSPGDFRSYESLLIEVWGPEYRDDLSVLWTWMSRLRGKLKSCFPQFRSLIVMTRGAGYRLDLQVWGSVFSDHSGAQ